MSQRTVRKKPRKNKKFRFQLLKDWIVDNYSPCRVADIAGGKGLLAYLLYLEGWDVTVIDPERTLPLQKFKDLKLDKRIKLSGKDWEKIKWREKKFLIDMAQEYDLLIALHAHGVNMEIINASAKYGNNFILLPCCVIDEPIVKQPGIDWFESLVRYAKDKGLKIETAEINFKGKNRIIFNKKT